MQDEAINTAVQQLANLIKESRNIVVLTGAGMDTESNIPDFRGKDGWWRNIDPRTVAHVDTLEINYPLFHQFYSMRINLLKDVLPHSGHSILASLEKKKHYSSHRHTKYLWFASRGRQ
jgi:NAD-dependent deacetylase